MAKLDSAQQKEIPGFVSKGEIQGINQRESSENLLKTAEINKQDLLRYLDLLKEGISDQKALEKLSAAVKQFKLDESNLDSFNNVYLPFFEKLADQLQRGESIDDDLDDYLSLDPVPAPKQTKEDKARESHRYFMDARKRFGDDHPVTIQGKEIWTKDREAVIEEDRPEEERQGLLEKIQGMLDYLDEYLNTLPPGEKREELDRTIEGFADECNKNQDDLGVLRRINVEISDFKDKIEAMKKQEANGNEQNPANETGIDIEQRKSKHEALLDDCAQLRTKLAGLKINKKIKAGLNEKLKTLISAIFKDTNGDKNEEFLQAIIEISDELKKIIAEDDGNGNAKRKSKQTEFGKHEELMEGLEKRMESLTNSENDRVRNKITDCKKRLDFWEQKVAENGTADWKKVIELQLEIKNLLEDAARYNVETILQESLQAMLQSPLFLVRDVEIKSGKSKALRRPKVKKPTESVLESQDEIKADGKKEILKILRDVNVDYEVFHLISFDKEAHDKLLEDLGQLKKIYESGEEDARELKSDVSRMIIKIESALHDKKSIALAEHQSDNEKEKIRLANVLEAMEKNFDAVFAKLPKAAQEQAKDLFLAEVDKLISEIESLD